MTAWLAICGLGVFHGLNPGMGWLFAVSNGMQAGRASGVFLALPPLAAGHLLAVAAVLVPASALSFYVANQRLLTTVAGLLLIGFGVYKLIAPRHPRFLARIGPRHLVLWSFLMASSHGAGLMVVPFLLGPEMLGHDPGGHAGHLPPPAQGGLLLAALVALVHTAVMILSAGALAWAVYRYLGLRLLQKAWFNLDLLWAAFLLLVGVIALASSAGPAPGSP